MKCFLLLFPLFLFCNSYSQTCIIAKKTKDAIYVGAESRGIVPYYDPITKKTYKKPISNLCKIQSYGIFNFTVCGIGFPIAMDECKKAAKNQKSFTSVAKKYITSFSKRLRDTLESIRDDKFLSFLDIVKDIPQDSNRLGRTIFFGVEADTLFLGQIDFYLDSKFWEPVLISVDAKVGNLFGGGHLNHIKDTIIKESTWAEGEVKTINALIKIEIMNDSLEVGGDIDIIKITTRDKVWIQRKKICN